jgi:hypothetical protein
MTHPLFTSTGSRAALGAILAALAGCGGGGDSPADAVATGATTGATTSTTTAPASTVAGCSGKVAAFFALAKGSYAAAAATFDNTNFNATPASVAGFAKGVSQTVTITENCTLRVGAVTLSYKDGSYAEFAGTGADAGKTQVDVDLTGSGVSSPHLERFTNGKRGLSLFDPTKTSEGVRFDE